MMKFRVVLLFAATVMLIGCRAAARHTAEWAQDRMTLTQSTFREPDVVPEVLPDAIPERETLMAVESGITADALIAAETAPPHDYEIWGATVPAARRSSGCSGEILDVAVTRRVEWRRSAKAS